MRRAKEDTMDGNNREEDELSRLKRQLRIMTNDKNALLGAYGLKASQQKKILEMLRKEAAELQLEVEVAAAQREEDRGVKTVEILMARYEKLIEDTKEKKKRMEELTYQIKDVQNNSNQLELKNAESKRFSDEKISNAQNELMKLENKLDTNVKQYCAVLAENSKLREEIESLLKDRKQFNETWERLIARLDLGKRKFLDLIDHSTSAYDLREEWMEKLNTLRYKAHNTVAKHAEEMRELKRQLDLQNELGEFLKKKCQKRVLLDLQRKEREKKDEAKAQMDAQLKEYKDTLQKIKDFVGEEDVNKIASHYLKQEEENFALFTYINELNTELENLATATELLREKILEQKELNEERANDQRRNVSKLQEELDKKISEREKMNLDLNRKQIQLQKMILGIADLFQLMDCDNAPLLQLLGDNTSINQHNVVLHMTILETKLMDIIQNYNSINLKRQHLSVPSFTEDRSLTPSPSPS